MKIETLPLENHQLKMIVEIEPETLSGAKQRGAKQLAKRAKIPGFRPGKAPYPVVLRQFGEQAVFEEAVEILANEVYPKALDEAGVKPYGPGSLQNINSVEPLVLEFVIPLEAEVKLGDYQSVRVTYTPPEVTDQEVDEVLGNLQDRSAILEPIDRPAGFGDMVTLKITAELADHSSDHPTKLIDNMSYPIIIKDKTNDENEWPFPGFSSQVVGMSLGESKTVEHQFSESTQFESLRGKPTVFYWSVDEVKSRTLPELNDEFASQVGEYSSLDELRLAIRSDLATAKLNEYNGKYQEEVLDQIIKISEVVYPPQMLENEIGEVIRNIENRLHQQNLDIDLYLKSRQMDMDALREEMKPTAEKRLNRSLVIYELAESESIQVDPDDLQTEMRKTLNVLSQNLPEKEAKKLSSRNVLDNLAGNVMVDLLSNKTLERVRLIASEQWPPQSHDDSAQEEEAGAEVEDPIEFTKPDDTSDIVEE